MVRGAVDAHNHVALLYAGFKGGAAVVDFLDIDTVVGGGYSLLFGNLRGQFGEQHP